MCESYNDESITTDSISVTLISAPAMIKSSPESRCCIGSGTSMIIDSEIGVEAESRGKLPSSRFKGVVPQPNGRWGAQIYEKHQRVWLGTFNEEEEAARSYDIAAHRFRGRDAVTNLKTLEEKEGGEEDGEFESVFLNSHSKAEIVDMLRKHTYKDEFEQSKKKFNNDTNKKSFSTNSLSRMIQDNNHTTTRHHREQLFEKAVTPSDVGKLNRLVIPKQHAEKHFPLGDNSPTTKGLLLNFEDVNGKVWRFRYSYWSSSQSYVLTKGWSRFVKEKNLKATDIVSFYKSTGINDKQFYIDLKPRNVEIQPIKMFRLFGVNIVNVSNENNNNNNNGKRDRGVDMLESRCCKKPKAINVL